MRRLFPILTPALGPILGLSLLVPAAWAQAPDKPPVPRALPTAVAPALTPLPQSGVQGTDKEAAKGTRKGAEVPRPAAALLPLPVLAPPLSPVVVPGAPPAPPPPHVYTQPEPASPAVSPAASPPAPPPLSPPPPVVAPPEPLPPAAVPAPLPPRKPALIAPPSSAPPPSAAPTTSTASPPPAVPRTDGRTLWAREDVNVRSAPNRDGRVVETLAAGEAVERLPDAVADGWVRIGRGGKPVGYVGGDFLTDRAPGRGVAPAPGGKPAGGTVDDDGCSLPPDYQAPRRAALEPGSRARVLTDANLRSAPGCNTRVLDVLEAGDTVTVSEARDGWYRVSRHGRPLGYISGALLGRAR